MSEIAGIGVFAVVPSTICSPPSPIPSGPNFAIGTTRPAVVVLAG
jgi:hypothetical protein